MGTTTHCPVIGSLVVRIRFEKKSNSYNNAARKSISAKAEAYSLQARTETDILSNRSRHCFMVLSQKNEDTGEKD